MNGLRKTFEKTSQKTFKINFKMPYLNKKPLARKQNFVQTLSLYFGIRAKKFHVAKPLAFLLHFLFRRDQNHYSNLTSKIMRSVNRS